MTSHFDHVMIDIESMSLDKHNALVLSVGMIEFDPSNSEALLTGVRELLVPEIGEQLLLGREVSKSTQKWWRDQDVKAAQHWLHAGDIISVRDMLTIIKGFCADKSRVWANGNQFDLANLEGLAKDSGFGELWHYQAPRDMRTFVRETPVFHQRLVPDPELLTLIPHHPVHDCVAQAWQVWAHWSLG